jgi:hypothetical protein
MALRASTGVCHGVVFIYEGHLLDEAEHVVVQSRRKLMMGDTTNWWKCVPSGAHRCSRRMALPAESAARSACSVASLRRREWERKRRKDRVSGEKSAREKDLMKRLKRV